MTITSRYSDIEGVVIDESKVPQQFRALIPLAKLWSISDDVELDEFIDEATADDK
jgi:hypothetical protein